MDIDVFDSLKMPVFLDEDETIRNRVLDQILRKKDLCQKFKLVLLKFMQELQEAGIQIVKLAGAGGRAITLKCLQKEKESVAIGSEASAIAVKIDSEAVHKKMLPYSTVFREVTNSVLMKSRLRNTVLQNIIPKHVSVCGGKFICGHTSPNEEDKVHCFEFCEYVEGSFRERFALEANEWSENFIFTDEFRYKIVLPLVHSVYFLGKVGFSIFDIKPDNIRINEKNEFVYTDLGLSVVHPLQSVDQIPPVLKPLNRIKPTQYSSRVCGKKLNGVNGQLHLFTAHDILVLNRSHFENKQPFPCLGVGTKGFFDNSKRGLQKNRMGGHIEKSDANAEDMFQVAMTLLRYFNKPTSGDWQEKAVSAANGGIDAMTKFMLNGKKNQGNGLPQPTAMRRYADLFCKWIGDDRMSAQNSLSQDAVGLLILEPDKELMAQRDGILFPGGLVRDMDFAAELNPDWHAYTMIDVWLNYDDGPKGLGIRAAESARDGAFAGFYPGAYLAYSDYKLYSLRRFSKYCVCSSGVRAKSSDNTSVRDKMFCDATPGDILTYEWFWKHRAWGPFMNAADKPSEFNVRVDRTAGWIYNGILWLPCYFTRNIRKDEWLVWPYDPKALITL